MARYPTEPHPVVQAAADRAALEVVFSRLNIQGPLPKPTDMNNRVKVTREQRREALEQTSDAIAFHAFAASRGLPDYVVDVACNMALEAAKKAIREVSL